MSATPAAAAREAAIAWRLCLSGGAATEADQRAFEAWLKRRAKFWAFELR
ncbi:DUF4880 domain-containing protein [Achromobacter xylosoxidans]|nr:DUF4880 domain-containing protein [Achromobacter xylosoxidans]MCZ8388676.1 DUF4880 domain-containing protein [Achromobacter xylosoxidans]